MLWPSLDGKWHKNCPECHCVQTYSRLNFARAKLSEGKVCRSCSWGERYKDLVVNGIPLPWFNKFKSAAKERGIPFLITPEDVALQFSKQNGLCALTGQDLSFKVPRGKIHDASIDRIDSNKPYSTDNIQIVHKDINMLKHTLPQEVFISLCKKVADYHK